MSRLKYKIYDWSGHNAIGDDLLRAVARNKMQKVFSAAGYDIKELNWGKRDFNVWGGGTILGNGDFFNLNAPKLIKSNKPYIVFGSGVRHPEDKLTAKQLDLLKCFADRATKVGVRGKISKEWFERYGIENIDIIGDAALSFEAVDVDVEKAEFLVGVSLRSMRGGLFRPEENRSSNEANIKLIAALCDRIYEKYNAKFYFFNLCKNRFDNDLYAIKEVFKHLKNKKIIEEHKLIGLPKQKDPIEVFSYLGKMNFVLSQRMHPSLMSWVQGVPSIGLDYQFQKTYDAFSALGIENYVFDIDKIEIEKYMSKIYCLISSDNELLQKVENQKVELIKKQNQIVKNFIKCIGCKL